MNDKATGLVDLDLENYNDKMSLSQVITFFDRHGIILKSTTIQNYVRVGVLPPVNNRYYTKNHIVYLALINYMKDTFSLEQIKNVFDIIDFNQHPSLLQTIYKEYVNLEKETIKKFLHFIKDIEMSTNSVSEKENVLKENLSSEEKNNLQIFLNSLLMNSIGVFIKKR